MAKVNVQVVGGPIKQIEARDVADARAQMQVPNHTAAVNGNPEQDSYLLSDYEHVQFSTAAKAA